MQAHSYGVGDGMGAESKVRVGRGGGEDILSCVCGEVRGMMWWGLPPGVGRWGSRSSSMGVEYE